MEDVYAKIKYYYEDRFDFANLRSYQKILNAYCKHYAASLDSFYGDSEEIFNTLHVLLLREGNPQKIALFYQLLEKYKYYFSPSLLLCFSDFCNATYAKTEEFLIEQYLNSPYILDIQKENSIYTIKSIFGDFEVQSSISYFAQRGYLKLAKLAKTKEYSDCCHDSAFLVSQWMQDSSCCTALCRQPFVGQYYHSFCIHDGYSIDLNYNCVLPKEQYFSLLQVQVLQEIPHEELENKLKKFSLASGKLFYSAIEEQIRKR